MSRDVEVTNISMVATMPEDIQISLGRIGSANDAATEDGHSESLANNTGVLYADGNADNGRVAPPRNVWDWADTADFSHYYQIGKLMPASSDTGANDKWSSMSGTSTDGVPEYNKSTNRNVTNDDGYYVDIPVWLRTSGTETTPLELDMPLTSGTDRWMLWRGVIWHIGERPLTGFGVEGMLNTYGVGTPHDEPLQYMEFFGIPAMLLYLSAVTWIIAAVLKKSRQFGKMTLVCFCVSVGYLVSSLFGVAIYYISPSS